MCGIAGLQRPNQGASDISQTLRKMTDVITHRGPDDEGFFCADGIGLGMRRLSIVDVGGGQQPITNETGTVHVINNGEIYNHRVLRANLESKGHQYRTHSDTESIVHQYEESGVDCFRELRGMFGAAIWDSQRNRLVLGRDRLGKKPLYYAIVGNQLFFGSEINRYSPPIHHLANQIMHVWESTFSSDSSTNLIRFIVASKSCRPVMWAFGKTANSRSSPTGICLSKSTNRNPPKTGLKNWMRCSFNPYKCDWKAKSPSASF